jgi:hypothetical protein
MNASRKLAGGVMAPLMALANAARSHLIRAFTALSNVRQRHLVTPGRELGSIRV